MSPSPPPPPALSPVSRDPSPLPGRINNSSSAGGGKAGPREPRPPPQPPPPPLPRPPPPHATPDAQHHQTHIPARIDGTGQLPLYGWVGAMCPRWAGGAARSGNAAAAAGREREGKVGSTHCYGARSPRTAGRLGGPAKSTATWKWTAASHRPRRTK